MIMVLMMITKKKKEGGGGGGGGGGREEEIEDEEVEPVFVPYFPRHMQVYFKDESAQAITSVADQTCYRIQSQCADTAPTSSCINEPCNARRLAGQPLQYQFQEVSMNRLSHAHALARTPPFSHKVLDPGRQNLRTQTRYLFKHYKNKKPTFFHPSIFKHTFLIQYTNHTYSVHKFQTVHTQIQLSLKVEHVPRPSLSVSPHDWL